MVLHHTTATLLKEIPMLSTDFTARANAIVYPTVEDYPDRADLAAAMFFYREAHRAMNQEFADALAHEYLGETVGPARLEAVAAPVFHAAWDHGHSSGYNEVENYYIDFAEIATVAYAAATS